MHVIQIVLLHIISMQDLNLPNGASDRVQLIVSEDGSHTLFVPRLNEHYHSTYGAVNESMHVYIQMGLEKIENTHVRILEVGFGTGLNALLTAMCAKGKTVCYHTFEKYPLEQSVWKALNYDKLAVGFDDLFFHKMHSCQWETDVALTDSFSLRKVKADFRGMQLEDGYDLVYFDAFGPDKQPDLWSEEVFAKIFAAMNHQGVLVTYCAKGKVRRMLSSIGFCVERLPGPPRKKEMLRATKP